MDTRSLVGQNELVSAMVSGKPFKSYKKVVLGKVAIKLWDSLTNEPKEEIFVGDPRSGDDAVIDVWSEKEQVYFERMNRKHFELGNLIEFKRPEVEEVKERTFEQYTDEEIKEVVNSRFLSLQSTLNKIESVAVLFRLKTAAEELEKSDKITKAIEARISELQAGEYLPKEVKTDA